MPSRSPEVLPAERQILAALGTRIRLARRRRKLTTTAVAQRAGISRTTLYKAESGGPSVTLGTYVRILATMGLDQDLALIAADDKVGRKLQDLTLEPGRRSDARTSRASRARRPEARANAGHRPGSLAEVVAARQDEGGIDAALREFLDEFYLTPDPRKRAAMLAREPGLLADERANAYLAAVAEHLARRYRLPVPEWTACATRFLKRPYFPAGLESLKATLLKESPAAFRRRMIFVDADPLYRPRKDAIGIGHSFG